MKTKLIIRYDVSAVLNAMYQEIGAWDESKTAERRYYAARKAWVYADAATEEAAAKERDRTYREYIIKSERYSAVGDMITALCDAVNVDYKALYAVAKAFRRRNERDFWARGTAAEYVMTDANEDSFRRLVAGSKTEWTW